MPACDRQTDRHPASHVAVAYATLLRRAGKKSQQETPICRHTSDMSADKMFVWLTYWVDLSANESSSVNSALL